MKTLREIELEQVDRMLKELETMILKKLNKSNVIDFASYVRERNMS